jgi:sRNA-binding protein
VDLKRIRMVWISRESEWSGWQESKRGYATSTPGTKRVDLDGREVGTVTEQEALAAKQRIYEFNEKRNEQRNSPVKVLGDMHARHQISDCAVKKLDAPPLSLTHRSSRPAATAPEFTMLYETLATANAAVAGISDPAMRGAVAKTLLDVVIKKFQEVRCELK